MIILIGHGGSGKTTLGRSLAKKLGYAFLDSDELLTQEYTQSPAQLIKHLGLSEFRKLEVTLITQKLNEFGKAPVVFSLGGGALDSSELIALLTDHTAIYLKAPLPLLLWRIRGNFRGFTLRDYIKSYYLRKIYFNKYANIVVLNLIPGLTLRKITKQIHS